MQRHAMHAVALSCSLLLASTCVFAQTNTKAAGYYEDALVRFDKNDMPGAIIQLKNALQIDPKMLPVQLLLGKALMRNGDVVAAEVALNEALRLGVNRAELVVMLGQSYMAQGKHKLILEQETFRPAGLPPRVQLELQLLRASVFSDLGEPANALKAIDEARIIDRQEPDVWLAEVPIRIRSRQFSEAVEACEKALALAPDSAQAWYQKGSIAHVQGNLADAVAAYDRAIKADDTHVEARVARLGILIDQGRFADAAKDGAELKRVAPREPRGAYLRALLAERDGDNETSQLALKEVTNLLDPVPIDFIRYRPQLLMLNGLAHFGLSQGEKAKQYLEAFQRVQNNSPASKLLARIYLADGNATQAVNVLETYLRAQPGDGQALTLLASAHMSLGRNAKATALMQEALQSKDDPAFRTALGLSLVGDGQDASGLVELEAAYKKDPRQTQAAVALVQLYLRNGLPRKAVPVAEQLVKLNKSNARFHNLLGMAHGRSGNAAAARAAFESAIAIDSNMTQAKLNLARLDIAAKAYDAATQRLNALLSTDARLGEAMYELSVIAERKGAQAEAQRWLEKARDAGTGRDVRADLALVEFHLRHGRPSEALDAAKMASGKAPDNMNVMLTYSRAQLAIGDSVGAKSTLTGATRFAEYNAPLQVQIATLQLSANNLAGAAYSLDKALSSRPNFLPALALMTEIELRQGERAKAEKRARDILAAHPKLAIGHALLGDIAMTGGQTGAAVEAYRQAHRIDASSASLLKLFYAMSMQSDARPALQLAEQWLKTHPRDLTVHKALANGQARAGNFSAAKAAYESALKIEPKDAELLNNLANVQLRLKDPGAVKTAEAALANAPGSALVTDTLGWALYQNGQTDRALQLLRDARLRAPGNPEIRYHLAAVLAKTGRTSEARSELESAINSGVAFESLAEAKALSSSLR
ncbi:MAG: PEP-CTERM system TPR-repeat protein PrsT [Rhodoferax sp.]|nr:PEP-CTERM system TPR-repeat protein PrsT [Rhodoferax sp.]